MRVLMFAVLIVLPALAETPAALAQSPAAPASSKIGYALLEDTIIRSGSGGQFESAQHDYCAAVVKGGAPACLVFSTGTFGESNRYLTLLPFASFIHYDQGKYTDKGLTPEEAKALNARRGPPVLSNHESAIALQTDLSILNKPGVSNDAYPLNYFTEFRLKPGTAGAFLDAIRRYVLPGAQKADVPAFEVFTTSLGESSDRVFIVTRLKNFASFDQPDPIQAAMSKYQREAFQIALATAALTTETYIMRYRTDISVDPRGAK